MRPGSSPLLGSKVSALNETFPAAQPPLGRRNFLKRFLADSDGVIRQG